MDWIPKETADALKRLDLSLNVHPVPEIDALLSKTVLFRGKKFRPMLCFLMGQFLKVDLSKLQPYARSAEFVHAATLAHDDVIDESSVRRNRPTLNAIVSNARAVLAGDLLLARVMTELAQLGEIRIIHELALTVEELVHGEWLQLEARKVADIPRQHLETVAKKKTASLMIWSCGVPAHLAKCDEEVRGLCRQFGEFLGIAFQMIDDIIDYDEGGEKPFAQDIREGLVNYVTLELIERQPQWVQPLQQLLGEYNGSPTTVWPWTPKELEDASNRVRARAHAKLEAANLLLDQILVRLGASGQADQPGQASLIDDQAEMALRSILSYLRKRIQ